jgi:hypothetical protein
MHDIVKEYLERVSSWLEGHDTTLLPDCLTGDERMVAIVSPHVDEDHAGPEVVQQHPGQAGLDEAVPVEIGAHDLR